MEESSKPLRLLDLPEIVVEQIFGYLSYEELAHFRIVCRRFNQVNQSLLNKGFRKVEQYQAKCLKEVKSQLPRRESERRNHHLYRHCDILTAIETRLSLLNMTFMKYVDCQMCCFIPGKVIDEIYRVLRIVQNNKTLPRSHEILTELRDISSMAMEHFEEKIIKTLKPASIPSPSRSFTLTSTMPLSSLTSELTSFAGNSPSSSSGNSLSKPHLTPQYLMASNKSVVSGLKKDISDLKSKIHDLRRKVSEQERVALEQNRILSEQTTKLISQEAKQNELNRKLLEYEQRFTELFAEIARLKEESGSGASSGLNWQANNKNNKFYVSHTVTSTPALGSLFITGSVMQPNLVPLNLAAAQMSPSPYLASSQLGAYSSGSLAFTMDPGTHVSSSSAVYSTSSLTSSGSQADSTHATNSENSPSTSGQNAGDRADKEEDNTEMRPPKSPVKKRSKRKPRETSDIRFNVFKKRRMDEK